MHGGSSPAAAHEAAEAEAAATDGATNAYVDPSAPATVSGTVAEFGTIPILRASEDGGSSNGSSSNDSNHSSGLNHIGDVGVLEGSPVPLSLPFTPLKPQNSLQSLLQTHATRIQQQQQEQQQAIGASNTVVPMRTAGRMGVSNQNRFRELMAANKPREDTLRLITPEELKKHCTRSDCWVALEGVVYDVSSYLRFHPGGSSLLLSVGGRDASKEFFQAHPWVSYKYILDGCRVGLLQQAPPQPAAGTAAGGAANPAHETNPQLLSPFPVPAPLTHITRGLPKTNISIRNSEGPQEGGTLRPLTFPQEDLRGPLPPTPEGPAELELLSDEDGPPKTPQFGRRRAP